LNQIVNLVDSTRVVCTSVGPFAKYGTELLAACAHYGTNYCDITGEIHWVRRMIDEFDEVAVKSGAKIISCCANDCIPWDITTFKLAQELKKKGE
jgi:short subunit dehydrogenase-like uncharacterized protein